MMTDLSAASAMLKWKVEIEEIEIGQNAAQQCAAQDGFGALPLWNEPSSEITHGKMCDEHDATIMIQVGWINPEAGPACVMA